MKKVLFTLALTMATVFPMIAGATAPIITSFYPSRAITCAGDSSILSFSTTGSVSHLYLTTPYGRFETTDATAPFTMGTNNCHILLPYWYLPVHFTLTAVGPAGDSSVAALTIQMINCDTPMFASSGISKDTACIQDADSVTVWWDPVREVHQYLIVGTDTTVDYQDSFYRVKRTTVGTSTVQVMLVGTISVDPHVLCDGDTISIVKSVFFKSCDVTGIPETTAPISIVTVYPVPATDMLIITSDHLGSTVALVDVNGRIVQHKMLDASQQQKVTLDVSSEAPGVYVIKGDTFTRTIVITR